jgi:hypothetical protein
LQSEALLYRRILGLSLPSKQSSDQLHCTQDLGIDSETKKDVYDCAAFSGLGCSFSFHDLAVLVSLIPHRTARMMFSKAGCPPIDRANKLFLTETQGM